MDWTDRHDRVFLRQFSKYAVLYTEMITSSALEFGDAQYLLQHSLEEHPVALQIGGSEPKELARAAKLGESAGFDEINLNAGCPSHRVKSGAFGACLMANPDLVSNCIQTMIESVEIPVTIKSRIGIDNMDSESELLDFVGTISEAGCKTFIIHARKAILEGLSPKQNREIPPLKYQRVFAVKKEFPDLEIIINGGIRHFDKIRFFLEKLDGVMVGREAYKNPFFLHQIDNSLFGEAPSNKSRLTYLEEYLPYIELELAKGTPLAHMARHILGLFKGERGGKQFRRYLSNNIHKKNAGVDIITDALQFVT